MAGTSQIGAGSCIGGGVLLPGVRADRGIPSHSCQVADLAACYEVRREDRGQLVLDAGWTKRWTTTWRSTGSDVVCRVRDAGSVAAAGCAPFRRFTWRTGQRHRPGLQYMVSTGRHHGFESLAEQRVLLALDFAGSLVEVLSQPFELRFATVSGWRKHVPDFLAVGEDATWLIDVRPGERIDDDARVCFAASDEVALAVGWRYLVVQGWRPHVVGTLDTLSARRRPMDDRLGLQAELCASADADGRRFGDLVASTSLPVVARAHLVHLIWHRRLSIDLSQPLGDRTLVWPIHSGR